MGHITGSEMSQGSVVDGPKEMALRRPPRSYSKIACVRLRRK